MPDIFDGDNLGSHEASQTINLLGNILDNVLRLNDNGTHLTETDAINLSSTNGISWTNTAGDEVRRLYLDSGGPIFNLEGGLNLVGDATDVPSFRQVRDVNLADDSDVGQTAWKSQDGLGALVNYGRWVVKMENNATGTENGSFTFQVMTAGTAVTAYLRFNKSSIGRMEVLRDFEIVAGSDLMIERTAGGDLKYVFQTSAITADRNVTLPLLTGNDTFVFEAHPQTLTNKTLGDTNMLGADLDLSIAGDNAERITSDADTQVQIYAGNEFGIRVRGISTENSVIIGANNVLATTATDGFLYLPTMAGAPTGNSTDFTGKLPIVWDSTNNLLMINTATTTWEAIGAGTKQLLAADGTEDTQTGTTPLEVKNASYIKDATNGIDTQTLSFIVEIKTDAGTGTVRIRTDGGGTDDATMTTTSTTFEIKSVTVDVSGKSAGRHTIEILIDATASDTITLRETQIYQE